MKRSVLLLLVLGLLVGGGLYSAVRDARPAGPMYALASERPNRVFAGRISIDTRHQPCTETPAPDSGTVPSVQCGDNGDIPTSLARLAARRESLDPDSLHAAALASVLWGKGDVAALNAAIQLLEKALRLAPDRVSLLVDLSATYLARAERLQNPRDLVAALQHAEEALAIEPANRSALFNGALAAEAVELGSQALRRWDAYLAAEQDLLWIDEAQERRRVLLEQSPAPTVLPALATAAAVDSFAESHPQEARLLGLEAVLGQWGSAMLNDSVTSADSLLELAEGLGMALKRRGGDASLADAVRAIHVVRNDRAATIILAQAHRDYGDGQALFRSDGDAAQVRFERLLRLNPRSAVLVSHTKVAKAAFVIAGLNPDEVERAGDSLRSHIGEILYPGLAARLDWIVGRTLFKNGRYPEARKLYARAARIYERLGEGEHYGATRSMEGWSWHATGDTIAAYRMVQQAMSAIRPYRGSALLNSVLFDMAKYVARDAMPLAAASIEDESLVVATQGRRPDEIAQGLIARAERWALTADTHRVAGDLDSAAVLVAQVRDTNVKERLTSMLRYSRAATRAGSLAALDSAIAFFTTDNALWRMAALMRRAELHLAAAKLDDANADLNSVTAHFWKTSRGEKSFHQRTAVMEQARNLFDKLVILHVEARRPVEALRALERGRVSFAPGGDAQNPGGPLMSPQNQVALEYALIGNQLLVWMVRGRTVTLFRRTVNRDAVLYAIDQANAALESVKRAGQAQPHLRHLHQWLIHPVRDSLGPRDTSLVVVADGEIAGVPFAALFDAEREQYLIEEHLLRFAATLAEAAQPSQFTATPGRRPLLIADPAFDREAHSTLKPLGGARAEMDSLLRMYPVADTISGTNATVAALLTRAPRASVIHYAGHAIFDDTRPERSFLVLAGTGRLSADTVGSMNLRGVRMVVLSACRTLRARQGRSGGFAGLSGALLNAGAGGVVGSLWKVEDVLAQPLMVEFHREYQRTSDPARALRHAQIQMLRSGDAGQKSPAAWAGFRYVGR